MYRSVSVRIEGVLGDRPREELSRTVVSLGGRMLSLRVLPDVQRTYALFTLPQGYDASTFAQAVGAQRLDDPALVVLEILPRAQGRASVLAQALGGAGRPEGVVDVVRTQDGVLVEWDAVRTPLCLLIDVIGTELDPAPGRRIVSILPLDDTVVAATARDLLGDPAIDVSRLIETYTESL